MQQLLQALRFRVIVNMSFTRDEEAKLIESISFYNTLYDPSDKNYKDIIIRENIWTDIAAGFSGRSGTLRC